MNKIYRVRKLIAIFIIALITVLSAASIASADQHFQGPSTTVTQTTQTSSVDNSSLLGQTQKYYSNPANKPSYPEQLIAGIIISFTKLIMSVFQLSDPVLLVFNENPDNSKDFLANGIYGAGTINNLVLGVFPKPFFDSVAVLYSAFKWLFPMVIVIIIIIIGILHMINSGSAQGRAKLKENAQFVLTAILVMRFGTDIWASIIAINNFFVKYIWAFMLKVGVKPTFFMDMVWGPGQSGINTMANMGSLPVAILLFLAAMMVLTLNYQYTLRVIILGLLITIFPLAAGLSIFPGFRHSLTMWFKEFVANVSLQLAHALALGVFFITVNTPNIGNSITYWLLITYFAGMPTIAALIRELIGLQGGGGNRVLAGASAMTGVAAMATMGRMVMRNPASKTGGGTEGVTGGSSSPMRLSGASSGIGKVAQSTFNGMSAVAGNSAVQKTGKFALGASAAVIGATISGAATGNPATGAMVGYGVGRVGGRMAGGIVGKTGGAIQTTAEALSSGGGIKGVGSAIMDKSIQNNGMIANAGWGFQAAANKVSSLTGHGEPFASPVFNREQKSIINSAQGNMKNLQPKLDLAKAKFDYEKTHSAPDSDAFKNAKSNYESIKAQRSKYESEALLAKTKLRTPEERHAFKASYSGGKI